MFNLNFTGYESVAQLIGFFGTIAIVIGMQQKKYDHIVFCKIANELFAAIHFFMLGGYTGMVINFASCFTNGVYWYRNKKEKSTLPFQIIFGTLFVVLGILSWQGWISIFVVLAKLCSSVALGIKSPRIIRILNLISSPCWLIYNTYMVSISGILGESLIIISIIVAMIRLDILKKEK